MGDEIKKKKPRWMKKHNSSKTKKEKERSPNYIVPTYNAVGCQCIVTVIVKPVALPFHFIFVIHLHI